jgi:AraC-like DNA-binding protein
MCALDIPRERSGASWRGSCLAAQDLVRKCQAEESATSWLRSFRSMSLAGRIKEVACHPKDRAEPVEIWKARTFIREHSDEELSLTKVAKAVNISSSYLSEKFRKVTGVNFVDYVARTRIEQACYLLRSPDLRISEIAFAVGFQSLSQFNRAFKRLSGKSPTEYRAMRL